ncbi:MAG: SRPBCC family protein [Isosphaeraceae bacterium]
MTTVDPKTDLVLERVVDVAPELVWRAWTSPEDLKKWFTPAPWKTVGCEIDLRPGGIFHTVMESPEGQRLPNTGCILEVVPNRRFVWTGALLPGYRPRDLPADVPFVFTAIIEMEPHGAGAKYTATVLHSTEEGRSKHETMGFHRGWGAALEQLVALARTW